MAKGKILLLTIVAIALFCVPVFAAKPVTLKWVYPGWDSPEQEKAVTQIIKDFEATHPNIKIELQNIPWSSFHDKLIISLQSSDSPDGGYLISRWLPEVQAMGKLHDLTTLRKELDLNDWIESSWLDGKFNGKYYSVPDRREPYVFFYNKKLFAEAGITEFPETMDEFLAAAKKLTKDGRYGVGLVGALDATLPAYYLNFLYAFNGSVFAENGSIAIANKAGVDALQFYVDLHRKYGYTQPSIIGDARDQVRNLFMTGQVAMMIDGLWATGTFTQLAPNLEWGIGKIPMIKGKERRTLMSGWDNVIFTGSKHKAEAWEFIKFYTQPENMAKAVVTLPTRVSSFDSARYSTDFYEPWKDAMQYGYPNPSTKYYERMMQYIGEAIQYALSGKMSVQDALKQAERQINEMEYGF